MHQAGDGEAALRLLAANTDTGILFLDYNMPILNGFQTVKKMREYANLAHVKIVMVSSAITKPLLAEFQNLGIAGFISKPFDMQKFNDIVLPILEAPIVGGTFVDSEGIPKSDVLRLFGSESPMVSFDGKKIAFNFQICSFHFFTSLFFNAFTAKAIAVYVLPDPAGPIPNTISFL